MTVKLTDEERRVLAALAAGGPSRSIAAPLRGRLFLYKLIDETTQGWILTEQGHSAIGAPPAEAEPTGHCLQEEATENLLGERRGGRKRRRSPFI
jgi:hypothetical protein